MNILRKQEEVLLPVHQPINFPTFHLIPETEYVRRKRRASNQPSYHQQRTPTPFQHPAAKLQRFITLLKQCLRQHCTGTWSRLKQLGRDTVRWLAWRVVLPLSVLCAIWVPLANPSELPL